LFGNALLLPLVWAAVCFFILYWVILLAVRHALADHARAERRTAPAED